MSIKNDLENLREKDIYSLMLFVLYKSTEMSEHSPLSELAYILDKDSLLKFCEYFGGMTIKVPTIEELEILVYSLCLFQQVNIEGCEFDLCVRELKLKRLDYKSIIKQYNTLLSILKDYNFTNNRE